MSKVRCAVSRLARLEWLTKKSCSGLIALSGGRAGDVGRAIVSGNEAAATAALNHWQEIFGDRFYLELIRTGRAGEEDVVQGCLQLAAENTLAVVASNDARFLDRNGFNSHEARVCIHDGRGLSDAGSAEAIQRKSVSANTAGNDRAIR